MDTPASGTKRMSPEDRKAQILQAAERLLSEKGLAGFSLDAVAREAGVANSLPRHYFGTHGALLVLCAQRLLGRALNALTSDPTAPLKDRLERYLDIIAQAPWGHKLWMTGGNSHPEMLAAARPARVAIIEAYTGRKYPSLSAKHKLHASGLMGYVERIVDDWIEDGMTDRDLVLSVLAIGLEKLQTEVG